MKTQSRATAIRPALLNQMSHSAAAAPDLWREHPLLRHLLGLSPLLIMSDSLQRAAAFALLAGLVHLASSLSAGLLPANMSATWRYFSCLLLPALFTTLAERLGFFLWPALHGSIGAYFFLAACNFLILADLLGAKAEQRDPARAGRSLAVSLAYGLALIGFAALREGLTWLAAAGLWPELDSSAAAEAMRSPALALLLLGLLIALYNALLLRAPKSAPQTDTPQVKRARVTGRLRQERDKG